MIPHTTKTLDTGTETEPSRLGHMKRTPSPSDSEHPPASEKRAGTGRTGGDGKPLSGYSSNQPAGYPVRPCRRPRTVRRLP